MLLFSNECIKLIKSLFQTNAILHRISKNPKKLSTKIYYATQLFNNQHIKIIAWDIENCNGCWKFSFSTI